MAQPLLPEEEIRSVYSSLEIPSIGIDQCFPTFTNLSPPYQLNTFRTPPT